MPDAPFLSRCLAVYPKSEAQLWALAESKGDLPGRLLDEGERPQVDG